MFDMKRIRISDETFFEVEKAKIFFKFLERKIPSKDHENNEMRTGNGTFSRDKVIRKALKRYTDTLNMDEEAEQELKELKKEYDRV